MNVTVHVAGPLRSAVEGRRTVELGMPPQADLGDLLETLLALYPRLQNHLPHEARLQKVQLQLLFDVRGGRPQRLVDGARVYLVAGQPKRLAE